MCAPRPKLPDTFSVDDLVKKGEREREREGGGGRGWAFGRVECATFRNKSARVKEKKSGERQKGKERQIVATSK